MQAPLAMPQFSKKIAIPNGGTITFDFTRIYTTHGLRYFVFVADKDLKTYTFKVDNIDGSWVIVDKETLPNWIIGLEGEFEKAILDH